ncbi:MAG: thioredoxin family protein [Thiovulaceae bacterium]|nr:thioredoxin family protein [Sulfurimonadaceae bacterium]MCW9026011.1 thioredoxin family protein [Sulfurimonadaceae bacterium]
MKFLLIFLFFVNLLDANYILWHYDFDKAHHKAVKEKKLLMALLLDKKASEYKEMMQEVFINNDYVDEINNNFISVLIIKDQKKTYPVELLYTLDYPALFFLNNEELFICDPLIGKITQKKIIHHLKSCK